MKETIEKFIDEVYGTHEFASVSKALLKKMISTLNPMKIDEERFMSIYNRTHSGDVQDSVQEYNSTVSEALQPLPLDAPDGFVNLFNGNHRPKQIWDYILHHYGTPTKKELVSVEELAVIIKAVWRGVDKGGDIAKGIAQHIIDTYSLNSTKREWWMDLKEGDKFMCGEIVHIFKKFHHLTKLYFSENYCVDISYCTPYIEPSTIDICKEKLGAELFEKLMKEVKG